jgi:hypothetical protein
MRALLVVSAMMRQHQIALTIVATSCHRSRVVVLGLPYYVAGYFIVPWVQLRRL